MDHAAYFRRVDSKSVWNCSVYNFGTLAWNSTRFSFYYWGVMQLAWTLPTNTDYCVSYHFPEILPTHTHLLTRIATQPISLAVARETAWFSCQLHCSCYGNTYTRQTLLAVVKKQMTAWFLRQVQTHTLTRTHG